jgi:RNA polymerase sigma-70 factor (ECF subfamily)
MADPGDSLGEESLWIRRVVASDDHDAFAELVRRHQSSVRQFLRRLTGNDWARADDLAQETFWRAYRHLASYQGRGRFSSWLFRIAYQQFVSDQRRRRGIVQVGLPEDLPAAARGPDWAARHTFDQLLATLRDDERAALVLHYRHELSHPEVALALDLPLGTVKSLIRRARLKLQEAHGGPARREEP